MKHEIPIDEIYALRAAHEYFGRTAKKEIRSAWWNGNYSAFPSHIDTGALQRFRNSEHGGPEGLHRLVLSKLPACVEISI